MLKSFQKHTFAKSSYNPEALPEPIIVEHNGIYVVRDDLILGGTKRRVLPRFLTDENINTYVYASPAFGYAQVALAHSCKVMDKKAVIFTAERKSAHPRTMEAANAGAQIMMVECGYLSVVSSRAAAYCEKNGTCLLPFGLDFPEFIDTLSEVAKSLPIQPTEVWSVAGSGVLQRALQKAWPDATFHAVIIGKAGPDVGKARVWKAPEKFEQDAKTPPPFPSCSNYDGKAWQFIVKHAKPGALFWNVAR